MSAFPEATDHGWRRRLRSRVLRWYDVNGRKLPWRESADPYRIWLSEIMLQQTTVAAVIPYFDRFTEQFPDVQSLAAAEQEQVLRLWEGLGYYSRARNLHKAANVIVDELDGQFPQAKEELQKLPGIGPYTAGAISSFAFNLPAGILEANTLRLYSRLIELDIDPRGTQGQKTLWEFADWVVAQKRAGDFNQAVMDIGSQVCRPDDPACPKCPLMPSCKGYEAGKQTTIPMKKEKPEITDVVEVSVAIRKGNRFLLRQRNENERWAGLWDFARFEISDSDGKRIKMPAKKTRTRKNVLPGQKKLFTPEAIRRELKLPPKIANDLQDHTGLVANSYNPVVEIKHAVTRYRIQLKCMVCEDTTGRIKQGSGYQWCSAKQLEELPLSTTGRQFAELLLNG